MASHCLADLLYLASSKGTGLREIPGAWIGHTTILQHGSDEVRHPVFYARRSRDGAAFDVASADRAEYRIRRPSYMQILLTPKPRYALCDRQDPPALLSLHRARSRQISTRRRKARGPKLIGAAIT